MLKTMKALVRDNSGDENITKMFWVAIVFIVGAILLVMVSTAFNGPIHDWYQKIIYIYLLFSRLRYVCILFYVAKPIYEQILTYPSQQV